MRALDADIRELRLAVAELEAELLDLRDLAALARRLARR